MLFKELVQQHRVDGIVAHGIGFPVGIASNQIGVHLLHFLGDEAKLRTPVGVQLL